MKQVYVITICAILILYSSPNQAAPINISYDSQEPTIEWIDIRQLPRYLRSYIRLAEEESVDNISVALVKLKENNGNSYDSLFFFNRNSYSCGSGGCLLTVFHDSGDGSMIEILSILSSDVSLGQGFTNGMRNLRFNDAVTWEWNGEEYDIR